MPYFFYLLDKTFVKMGIIIISRLWDKGDGFFLNSTILIHIVIGAISAFLLIMLLNRFFRKDEVEKSDINDVLLNSEELKRHAQELAQNHYIIKDTKLNYLLIPKMNKSYNYIKSVYRSLNTGKDTQSISQDAEWLLDNFYIIEEQVKAIRRSISRGYYSGLPGLKNSILKGFPRVYALSSELVSHTDGKVDEDTIINFINAYQTKSLLSSGELWALGTMISIALIENIKRSSEKIVITQRQWKKADDVADILLSKDNITFDNVKNVLRDNIIGVEKIPTSFFERLLQRLRENTNDSSKLIQYIDRILQEFDTNINDIVLLDHQILAQRQVSIGNAITSLKYVSMLDWAQIFEKLSSVEQILKQDPDGTYTQMDFESRDYYRHEIEKIAKRYNTSETFVARKAIECAKEVLNDNAKPGYINHVGFYIIGKGKSILTSKLDHKKKGFLEFGKLISRYPAKFYITSIICTTLFIELVLVYFSINIGGTLPELVAIIFFSIIPISEISVQFINWFLMHINKPTILPKIELSNGIPNESSTMVIIPTLLTSVKRVKELISQLEVIYNANKQKNLYFALVGDFKDSKNEKDEDDDEIVRFALDGIKKLNKKYSDTNDIFFYFHRKKVSQKEENSYMGWERKRGAIVEFNELLRGKEDTNYYIKSVSQDKIPYIKYVITIDADTNITMDNAKRLVGTMIHPLNKAVIDKEKNIVVEGYGLLQPRIGVDMLSANATRFSQIFAGQGGIDPYTTAVSDVYQDLFGEGIYTGKGIYDVDVFRSILKDLIPDNTVLSHDLLEGSFVRTGLVTDIMLIDGFPSKYNSYIMRMHRWVRGDWQLIPWLFNKIKNKEGKIINNPLTSISKWKMVDNMRRSMVSPFLALLLFLGFSVFPGTILPWLFLVLFINFLPFILSCCDKLINKIKNEKEQDEVIISNSIKNSFLVSIIQFIFLPYQAYMMVDAIIRTLYRVFISKKKLLEWVTAADMEKKLSNDLLSFINKMWISVIEGIALVILCGYFKPGMSLFSYAIALLWILSPYIAYIMSYPIKDEIQKLSNEDISFLRKIARKTWNYFEDFVIEDENFLPPDNFQLDPYAGTAKRTSPTNIGLYLASCISARDMGFINGTELLDRVDKTLNTIEKMEKWNGHLYNWYKTNTLEPLRPFYVSTVDSGNFVGYLISLKEGLEEYIDRPITDNLHKGLRDTLEILGDSFSNFDLKEFDLENNNPKDFYSYLNYVLDKLNKIKVKNEEDEWLKKAEDMAESYKTELEEFIPSVMYENIDFKNDVSLRGLKKFYERLLNENKEIGNKDEIVKALSNVNNMIDKINNICNRLKIIIEKTEFRPLYDEKRQLFSIGYNVDEEKLTKSYYDLFASEARQASFIAIAKREVDIKHWFRMGRMVTKEKSLRGLVSWSGTMFEYFMPLLLMRNYSKTIMDMTYKFVVMMQKKYSKKFNIPWGISESGFYSFDTKLNYQYKAFGVPGLGLKRGLSHDLVIAPYATILALPIDPIAVTQNLYKLKEMGMIGKYGFYESIDFTPERIPFKSKYAIVKSFMSHHHGMSILALNNFINNNLMQDRFHRNPVIKAYEVLLQEKIPEGTMVMREEIEAQKKFDAVAKEEVKTVRKLILSKDVLPNVHILSNGEYSTILTDRGTGYSQKEGVLVTRWSGKIDKLDGTFIFIQNINSNMTWSVTYAPFLEEDDKYRIVFSQDMAKFSKRVGNIDTETEVIVSQEDNVEIRRITLKNHSQHSRILEVTSYLEPVLNDRNSDTAHPAFNKLFVSTEYLDNSDIIIANRRPRDINKPSVWASHAVCVEGCATIGDTQFETDRLKFIGRGRSMSNPIALEPDMPLTGSQGPVLDPILSLRKRIKLEGGQTARVIFTTSIANSKIEAIKLANKYKDPSTAERAFEMSLSRGKVELDYLNLKSDELLLFQKMLPHIVFLSPIRRKKKDYILKNNKGQSGLWQFGISGDLPIILFNINKREDLKTLKQLLKAHEYFKMKGFSIDLVILNSDIGGYIDELDDKIKDIINGSFAYNAVGKYGGIFLLKKSNISDDDFVLINTVANLTVNGDTPIAEQLKYESQNYNGNYVKWPMKPEDSYITPMVNIPLYFGNGFGGFSEDGHSYIINLNGNNTPVPWVNVISNYKFGFIESETGGGYTWAENSREYKLTPWSNDPIIDEPGEILYVRDNDTGEYWSITPEPIRKNGQYTIIHGFGKTEFKHVNFGIKQDLLQFVPMNDTVKINIVKFKNLSDRNRNISIYYYIRPVLGVSELTSSPYIVTEMDNENGALFISNKYNEDFKGRVGFISASEKIKSYTGSLSEFLGTNFDIRRPESLKKEVLSNNVGAGLIPCAAIQIDVELTKGSENEICFILGSGTNKNDATRIIKYYKNINNAKDALDYVNNFWDNFVNTINVKTPDKTMDLLLNGWLIYEVISCRIWGRSAFYQSGGAYGFRDQLQDSMNVVYSVPEITRAQILNACAHQYKEGDVMHWWHPGTDKGIRTRYSDDLLWLPYVVADYINVTGDKELLNTEIQFLEDEPLKEGENERYNKPKISKDNATVYEHCIRAIEHSLKFGPHDIPLMGSGDWNDGMNMVGNKGKGESVWLAWFIYKTLKNFIPICLMKGDNELSEKYKKIASEIANSTEENAWDGSWYKRAFFDDGTPLGSSQNTECKIDSISQSWSLISGASKQKRAKEAMDSVENYLIDYDNALIKLLSPPFDKGNLNPGYIKGYVPGVRENGGQYTHAAIWVIMAYTIMGDGDKAWKLYNMINPINHTRTPIECAKYKVEPYVMAADVYAVEPNVGRGGWTWYTGSSGWMYRVGIENILGFKKRGETLLIDPCIPKDWGKYEIQYKYKDRTKYIIEIENPEKLNRGVQEVYIDGKLIDDKLIKLVDDGVTHKVSVILGTKVLSSSTDP